MQLRRRLRDLNDWGRRRSSSGMMPPCWTKSTRQALSQLVTNAKIQIALTTRQIHLKKNKLLLDSAQVRRAMFLAGTVTGIGREGAYPSPVSKPSATSHEY